jgi:hypothetical protein
MKLIKLTRGKFTSVDDADYSRVMKQGKWQAWKSKNGKWYAQRSTCINGKRTNFKMHRFIVGAKQGEQVDHKDRDTLNNQRYNLRRATDSQNQQNKIKKPKCSSEYKGVCWKESHKQWYASISAGPRRSNGRSKRIFLGLFSSEIKAAKAYDRAARKFFGKFAHTNF